MRFGALHCLMILPIASVTPQPISDQAPLSMEGNPLIRVGEQASRDRVPGDSPVHYVGDPRNDILTIQQLDMIPNPVVMQVHGRSLLLSLITDKS